MKKPTKAGWYWKKVEEEDEPVEVFEYVLISDLHWRCFSDRHQGKVKDTNPSEWGERIERKKRRKK